MPRLTSVATRALVTALLLAVVSCDTSSPTQALPPVAAVQLTPAQRTLAPGETVQLGATPLAADGAPLGGRPVAWRSGDESIVTVSAQGLVTAVGAGTAHVIATVEGREGRSTITVTAAPVARVTLDVDVVTLVIGDTRQLVATPRDAQGQPLGNRAVVWAADDVAIATVSTTGLVTGVSEGSTRVIAMSEGRTVAATVRIVQAEPYDLLYDARTSHIGLPELYRLDLGAAEPVATRLLAAGGGYEVAASPDGLRIAFTCSGDGPGICVASRDGANVVRLTPDANNEDQPAWSPDGTRIAFRRWSPGGPPGPVNPPSIWVMNADGTGQVQLTEAQYGTAPVGATSQNGPTWSPRQPDGSHRIAYSQQSLVDGYLVGHIRSMRADGTDVRQLTASGGQLDEAPTWSPDGQAIVFVRTGGAAGGDLWRVPADGSDERPLLATELAGAQHAPVWSPDGRLIAFTSKHEPGTDGGYQEQIYTVRADGSHPVRRTIVGVAKENPAWITRP